MTQQELKLCFEQWFDEIRNYITYRCCDEALATDIVQEAFIKVWEKDLEYQQNKTRSLIYKIANELWISHYRKKSTEKKYKLSLTLKAGYNDTEEQLDYQELKIQYEEALVKLPEDRRAVFLMSRMEDLSYREIAERLNVSIKTIEKRMSLALKELRKKLSYGKQKTN